VAQWYCGTVGAVWMPRVSRPRPRRGAGAGARAGAGEKQGQGQGQEQGQGRGGLRQWYSGCSLDAPGEPAPASQGRMGPPLAALHPGCTPAPAGGPRLRPFLIAHSTSGPLFSLFDLLQPACKVRDASPTSPPQFVLLLLLGALGCAPFSSPTFPLTPSSPSSTLVLVCAEPVAVHL